MAQDKIFFDRGPFGSGTLFQQPVNILRADRPDQVPGVFAAMQEAQSQGKWLAGYLSYEFGYLTSNKLIDLMRDRRELPLIHFAVFDAPVPQAGLNGHGPAMLTPPVPSWDLARYTAAFETLHDYISAGDIYQANLTFPMTSRYSGDLNALYAELSGRQRVPHGAMVDFDGVTLLSRSPELFFALSADGELTTRPMKGTAPRGDTPAEDDRLRDWLHNSEKDRAENLMIVDLLRNDMSRVSQIGSVKVPDLFSVERYATLHQMTSRITSRLISGTSLADLFEALFPCGSITGAPKVRAMQIIHELEPAPREAYCGAIGWIAPSGAMEFNVAIRTLMCRPDGTVQLNVGGGVVYDSTAKSEYEEALLKSRYANLPMIGESAA